MKRRAREFDIFNLSFLDIISCGFGAVVMLVLISKTSEDVAIAGKDQIEDLLRNLGIGKQYYRDSAKHRFTTGRSKKLEQQ